MDGAASSSSVISEWQGRLRRLIGRYEDYRGRTRKFWRFLFLIFFLLNSFCYQFAIISAFPERAFGADWLRYVLIMFPVGIFGATFDCASFVVTLAIMRHAIRVKARLIYLGHITADIAIAILATGWVLIVFSISTVLVDFVIGPPAAVLVSQPTPQTVVTTPSAPPVEQPVAPAIEPPAPSVEQPVAPAIEPPAPSVEQPVAPAIEPPAPQVRSVAVPADESIEHAQFMAARAQGYRERVADALNDPFSSQNLRNIYFGVVMGLSAMLPSLLYLYVGFAAFLAVTFGASSRAKATRTPKV
jgi:hypothetical protein